jgi:hypothetical protein
MRNLVLVSLMCALVLGCAAHRSTRPATLSYSFRPADVANVSARAIDTNVVRWAIGPSYKAELHLKLNSAGTQRFEHFNVAYEGQVYDLLVSGDVLASGLTARPQGPVAEMVWYVDSMERANHFANALNAR